MLSITCLAPPPSRLVVVSTTVRDTDEYRKSKDAGLQPRGTETHVGSAAAALAVSSENRDLTKGGSASARGLVVESRSEHVTLQILTGTQQQDCHLRLFFATA